MGALTSQEREALDDLFLSINTTNTHHNIIQHIIIIFNKWVKVAKIGLKNTNFYKFLLIYTKKKNNLSK